MAVFQQLVHTHHRTADIQPVFTYHNKGLLFMRSKDNSTKKRHSNVRKQILRIFAISCIIPVLFLGIFSATYTRKQMTDQYRSLAKSEGIRVNSVMFDITTSIYNISEAIIDTDTCRSLFSTRALSDSDVAKLDLMEDGLKSYINSTAAISSIHIYTDNEQIPGTQHISYASSFDDMEWYGKIKTSWSKWTELSNYTIINTEYQEIALIRKIAVPAEDLNAYLIIHLDNNYIKNRIDQSGYDVNISIDDDPIIFSTVLPEVGQEMVFPEDFTGKFYKYSGSLKKDGSLYMSNYVTFQPYKTDDLFFIQVLDEDAYVNINRIFYIFMLIILLELIVPSTVIIYFSNYFSNRIRHLKDSMHQARMGDYNITDSIKGDDELTETFEDLKATVDNVCAKEAEYYQSKINKQELENKQQQMEFELLASQINPHFLYNTLETIRMQALAAGNRDVATSVKLLGKSMHYVLENTGTSFTTLTKELEYIKTYLSIQQIRFGDRVNFSIEIDDSLDTDECRILPLLLQPIVENGIIHGLENRDENGLITISIQGQGSDLIIEIRDNGDGMDELTLEKLIYNVEHHDASDRQSIGLYNISQRIRLLYGDGYYMHIESRPGDGTSVTLKIPQNI